MPFVMHKLPWLLRIAIGLVAGSLSGGAWMGGPAVLLLSIFDQKPHFPTNF
ncbi:MAG: hypothetical protein OEW11_11575 [Nitrospirota bacterium]|nr:hypothetical protein [Nitrospirota bacterium]